MKRHSISEIELSITNTTKERRRLAGANVLRADHKSRPCRSVKVDEISRHFSPLTRPGTVASRPQGGHMTNDQSRRFIKFRVY